MICQDFRVHHANDLVQEQPHIIMKYIQLNRDGQQLYLKLRIATQETSPVCHSVSVKIYFFTTFHFEIKYHPDTTLFDTKDFLILKFLRRINNVTKKSTPKTTDVSIKGASIVRWWVDCCHYQLRQRIELERSSSELHTWRNTQGEMGAPLSGLESPWF